MNHDNRNRRKTLASLVRAILTGLLSYALACPAGLAQSPAPPSARRMQPAQEYYSDSYQGELLMPVKILGAVKMPGIYHVPKKTDLVTLMVLAGGLTSNADQENVYIKRRAKDKEEVLQIDLSKTIVTEGSVIPLLETDDIVMVESKEPIVSTEAMTLLGVVASILSILISGMILNNQTKN